jgi:hypothetical protein
VGRLHEALGIRLIDVGACAAVLAAVEINVATGNGPGAQPLNALAYVAGGVLVIPVLFRRRWPLRVLIACSVLLLFYYWFDRRDISPAPSRLDLAVDQTLQALRFGPIRASLR